MVRKSYSYMNELPLNGWDGRRSLVVFDGVCVLCSFFAKWVLARDKSEIFVFTTAQSPLGQALYKHYGLDPTEFETNLVIINGMLFEKMYGALAICRAVGFPWRVLWVFSYLPGVILNWFYERIARNRYALFGKQDSCIVPTADLKKRMVGFDE